MWENNNKRYEEVYSSEPGVGGLSKFDFKLDQHVAILKFKD